MTINQTEALNLLDAGKWNEAHFIVKNCSDKKSCLLNGYLHRALGD